jgi:beta-lactamase superfamily II metal-dependent hydrolase
MPWELEIWHIDLVGKGDSTLIVARNGVNVRSALIDGGLAGASARVHRRVVALGLTAVNVMIATHYDNDHYQGLRRLLQGGAQHYDNTRIYDQGRQDTLESTRNQRDGTVKVQSNRDEEDSYARYVKAITGYRRVRVTENVLGRQTVTDDLRRAGYHNGDWLVGKEVLWQGTARIPAGTARGRPTLTCIAANQYVLQADSGDNKRLTNSTLNPNGDRERNAKSLAFLLQFGNFKYYVGGDIEARQEDGSDWNDTGYTVNTSDRARSLMRYLNPSNNDLGRVHAMKTSHHGSKRSSSPAFIARLRPQAAIISCGTDNSYLHPDQEVIDTLENNEVDYFLTGENLRDQTVFGLNAEVAGVWLPGTNAPTVPGDIGIKLKQQEANTTPPRFRVIHYQPDAGTNTNKSETFRYTPYGRYITTYN